MKRIFLSLALTALCALGANAQLLYRISGNGLQQPSYVVGTYHLAPVSFADSIAGLRQALDATQQVYGEMDMSLMTTPDNLQKMQAAMMLPQGTTLQTLLSADEMARLNAVLADLLGFDMTNPMMAQQLGALTPQALNTQLSLMTYMKKRPGFDPANPIDAYFQREARQAGKDVGGLETIDLQIDVLYKSMTLERQKELLMCMVDHRDAYDQMTSDIISAYFAQDIEAVGRAMDEKLNNTCDSSPAEEDALIYNRNANWAGQMPAIMAAKPTFFAVGAAHLPGSRGLLQLLRNAGYTVEGVK